MTEDTTSANRLFDMESYYIRTFGCQMNEHDSIKMDQILASLGMNRVTSMEEADLILFNTCTVRDKAQHKANSEIGRASALKRKMPSLRIGVSGCVAQQEKENIFRQFPMVDLIFGPDQVHQLPALLKKERRIAVELIDNPGDYVFINHECNSESVAVKANAFVKIIKGCNNNCSFCIVPSVRGREVSRSADAIIDEVKNLTERGVREITLLGQNVNAYRSGDITNKTILFPDLIRRIEEETAISRIRYTSPHPRDYCDDLIDLHASSDKLCRSVHMPLQSGSSRILALMKRSYNRDQYLKKTMKLREKVKGIEISTDIIVGFPGETKEELRETLDMMKEVAFDYVYAFTYSPRPGTKAAHYADDVSKEEKEERLQQVLDLTEALWEAKKASYIGSLQEVLVEGESKNGSKLTGRSFANKVVNFPGERNLIGRIIPVHITEAGNNSLHGEAAFTRQSHGVDYYAS